jgi:DNA processing protein
VLPGPRMTTHRFELRRGDPGYPACLLLTPRPPRVLYGMGDPSSLVPGLAVIGSRKATPYGLACADHFAGWAAAAGVIIISGAAIGCDQRAQRSALSAGGRSIAVLGCGADVDYPHSSRDLLAALRAGEGAVVSELEWGTPPVRGHFPARNRIIAGLSRAVLVVEAALPSGTFSTADHALEASREVFCVPGSVLFAGSAGCNRLLRQGARVIACVADLADELAGVHLIDAVRAAEASTSPPTLQSGEASDDRLLRALLADPMGPGTVADALGLHPSEVLRRIAVLESKGWIARYPDGRFGPCLVR